MARASVPGLVGGVNPHYCPPGAVRCRLDGDTCVWTVTTVLLGMGALGLSALAFSLPEDVAAGIVVGGRFISVKRLDQLRTMLTSAGTLAAVIQREVCS